MSSAYERYDQLHSGGPFIAQPGSQGTVLYVIVYNEAKQILGDHHDALGESSTGFALSYAAFQLILTYMWWRTGVHDPDHRPLSRTYSGTFLISTLMFIGSIFVAEPVRFYLWGVALILMLMVPAYLRLRRNSPQVQAQLDLSINVSNSLVEVRRLLLMATALVLVTTALLTRTTQVLPEHQRVHDIGRRGLFISAVFIMLLGFVPLNTIPLLTAITVLLLMPIFFGLRVWVEVLGEDELANDEISLEE